MEQEQVVSNATPESVSDHQEKKDFVKYDTHSKLLGQHKKAQEEVGSLQEQLNAFKSAEQQRAETELAKQGEHKKIIELREQKIAELTDQLTNERNAIKDSNAREATTWKLQSFYSKLPGKIKDSAYLQHVDLDSIVYDSESMSCDDQSVDKVVNDFMEKHSHLVEPTTKAKLSGEAPVNNFNMALKPQNKEETKNQLAQSLSKMFGA